METNTPNPGSKKAREQGCLCPVMDNGYGSGYMGQKDIFVMVENCPIHGQTKEEDKE